jgi:GNAT superfamily N-acetyltransferase
MSTLPVVVRPIQHTDYAAWRPLWDGYNAFYKRVGPTALGDDVTAMTWARLFDVYDPVHARLAEADGKILGLVHYLYHRSTTMLGPVCYLQDLYTSEASRGQGVGRALIHAVYADARVANCQRVYWHTHETNSIAMKLYDQVADRPGAVLYRKDL